MMCELQILLTNEFISLKKTSSPTVSLVCSKFKLGSKELGAG